MRRLVMAVVVSVVLAGCAVPAFVMKADPAWCGGKHDPKRGTNFVSCDGTSPIATVQHGNADK